MMTDSEKKALLDEVKITSGVNPKKCMVCGKCTATCPGYDDKEPMDWKPHQFVQMFASGDVEALMSSALLYRCMSCMACLERCPRQVEPARVVAALRIAVERRRAGAGGDHMEAEDIALMADTSCVPQQALVSAFRKYRK